MPAKDIAETQTGGVGETIQSGAPVEEMTQTPELSAQAPIQEQQDIVQPQQTPDTEAVVPQSPEMEMTQAQEVSPDPPERNEVFWQRAWNFAKNADGIKMTLSYDDFVNKWSENDERIEKMYNFFKKAEGSAPTKLDLSSLKSFRDQSIVKPKIIAGAGVHVGGGVGFEGQAKGSKLYPKKSFDVDKYASPKTPEGTFV